MDNALNALLYPFDQGDLDFKERDILFLNARWHEALASASAERLHVQQYFKPFAKQLSAHGLSVISDMPQEAAHYDVVLIKLPKNKIEALYLIAAGLQAIKSEGVLVCAADNKAGGTRIKKMLKDFGISDVAEQSKFKARVVWSAIHPDQLNHNAIRTTLKDGEKQSILDDTFQSIPGMFGWNKIDQGSKLLTDHLPKLSGIGADFGCGYGYLSAHILDTSPEIKELYCIDADQRAITCVQENLKTYTAVQHAIWDDLTSTDHPLHSLDFIVMNPPFHEEKRTDTSIGERFIKYAAAALRTHGDLWMVANNNLPYEEILSQSFSKVEKPYEGQGFKIFHAVK